MDWSKIIYLALWVIGIGLVVWLISILLRSSGPPTQGDPGVFDYMAQDLKNAWNTLFGNSSTTPQAGN